VSANAVPPIGSSSPLFTNVRSIGQVAGTYTRIVM
jgi:hypothetical protein